MARSITASGIGPAAVGQRPQRREAAAVGLDDVEDAAEHGRHDHGVGDALGAHERRPTPAARRSRACTTRRPE